MEKKSSNQNERRNKRSLGTKKEQIAAEVGEICAKYPMYEG